MPGRPRVEKHPRDVERQCQTPGCSRTLKMKHLNKKLDTDNNFVSLCILIINPNTGT
jgi:hypothetical protein